LLILNLVDIAALILLDYLEENAENREKLIAANERAHVQDENIQALSQAYAGQRKMTHDFRANLSTLSELLESERVDDAKEFLSELNVRQSERILLVNSHNAAIDAVLNQKGYIGKKQGIDMRFRVNDLSALKLPRVDVTIVLGNLIDNAMEACAGLSEPNRWVSIQILYSENMLSILIINPSNIVQINGGHIPTTKQDPLLHGFGIGNVKDILEKYHAEYLFTYDDGRFIFSADWPDIAEPSVNTSILS
jgi:two-component system sensor histidine kinase AgrC